MNKHYTRFISYGFGILCIIVLIHLVSTTQLPRPETLTHYVPTSEASHLTHSGPGVLIINIARGNGGGEIYTMSMYERLRKRNINVHLLVQEQSWLARECKKRKLPCFMVSNVKHHFGSHIYTICTKQNIDIVHGNCKEEIVNAKRATQIIGTKLVFSRHLPRSQARLKPYCRHINSIIGVSPEIINDTITENNEQRFNLKHITYISPFFNDEQFINFSPQYTKKAAFFKNVFDLHIPPDVPVLTCVARLTHDKNQVLLLKALHKVIYESNIPVHTICAGYAPVNERKIIDPFRINLGLEKYVHFIGNTHMIPELLYHSDIVVLPSKKEGFGIALLEGALMKKPLIGARGTGAINTVLHKQTGLLFDNDNADDLAEKIKILVTNPTLRYQYGQNAYAHVTRNLSSEKNIDTLLDVYKTCLKRK